MTSKLVYDVRINEFGNDAHTFPPTKACLFFRLVFSKRNSISLIVSQYLGWLQILDLIIGPNFK